MEPMSSLLMPTREPTPLEQEAIRELIDIASQYHRMDRDREFLNHVLATLPRRQTALIRFIAPNTIDHQLVMALLDDMVTFDPTSPYVVARNGTHHRDEIVALKGLIHHHADGTRSITWPISYMGTEPIYPTAADRVNIPRITTLDRPSRPRERYWWEDETVEQASMFRGGSDVE